MEAAIVVLLAVIAVELFAIGKKIGVLNASIVPWPPPSPEGRLPVDEKGNEKLPSHSKCGSIFELCHNMACAQETFLRIINRRQL